MKKVLFLSLVLLLFVNAQSQNYLNTYFPLGTSDTIQNPPINPKLSECGMISPLKIGSNNDFRVRVKNNPGDNWQDLFEYNTFVNSTSGDLSGVTRSSFVSFDYSGTVIIEIKCNEFSDNPSSPYSVKPENVIIRPQSMVINRQVSGQIITFTLTPPPANSTNKDYSNKLSVEINGNRYKNLQIFANRKYVPVTNTIFSNDLTFKASGNNTLANVYPEALNSVSNKKIKIEKGAILSVPYLGTNPPYNSLNGVINLNAGDEIFIEGGGVLNGGLIAKDKDNVKVYGRGTIDLTNYPKKYDQSDTNAYAWVQPLTFIRSKNITLDGLVINDSQQLAVELTDCGGTTDNLPENVNINNMKIFTHAIWGDGYHMRGTMNVSINDCFNRTSDDCISIYASRRLGWDLCDSAYQNQVYNDPFAPGAIYPALNKCALKSDGTPDPNALPYLNRDALNIKVTNTLLYADNAHAIEIGWHGNQMLNNGKDIYNLYFDNIDILEHDQNWVQRNGNVIPTYDGAIGINCSDDNKCGNFLFRNIRIEDFTAGSIMAVRVMPFGEGDAYKSGKIVQDIRFENLTYTGTGQNKSIISGVNCDRFVNGVHFENFNIKTSPSSAPTLVTGSNWLNYFNTNDYAYNITFQEANNYTPNALPNGNGLYRIQNVDTPSYYLQYNNTTSPFYSKSGTDIQNSVWRVEKLAGVDHYLIKPNISGLAYTLENTFIPTSPIYPNTSCKGRYLTTPAIVAQRTNQQWKFFGNTTSGFNMINAYSRGYLTLLKNTNNNEVVGSNTISLPKELLNTNIINSQKWKFIPYTPPASKANNGTDINPADTILVENNIQIFPNPTKDLLNINNVKNLINTTLEVIDLNGKKVISEEIKFENTVLSIANLANGLYVIKIMNNNKEIYSQKIVKN